MGNFVYFQFTSQGTSDDKPDGNHLFIETTNALYMVSDTDNSIIKKSTDGLTWSEVEDRDSQILSSYYDRDNEMIYFLENDLDVFRIDLSDDSVDEYGTCSDLYELNIAFKDIFILDGSLFIAGMTETALGGGLFDYYIEVFKWVDPNWVSQDSYKYSAGAVVPMPLIGNSVVIIDDVAWMSLGVGDIVGNQYLGIFTYDDGITTLSRETKDEDYTINIHYQYMLYDGSDILYFGCYDPIGGDYYLTAYSIGSNTLTYLREFTGFFQLDRNCLNEVGSPWEHEKGWDDSIIYKNVRGYTNLLKLQDLNLSGETIIAISDNYLMTSTPTLYKYTNCIDKLLSSGHEENIFSVPTGSITHSSELSTDQLIEIWWVKETL